MTEQIALFEKERGKHMDGQVCSIKTQKDIEMFLEQSNCLHDGYILSAQFSHNGYKPQEDGSIHVYPEDNELRIRILITSIGDTVIELIFKEVSEWQVHDNMWDIMGTAVFVSDDGKIIWTDGFSTDEETRKNGSYVVARSMGYHPNLSQIRKTLKNKENRVPITQIRYEHSIWCG